MEWFTSDLHFNHKNIVEYCHRPYRTIDGQIDVQAMDRDLIARWNERVGRHDTVYLLGDFAMGPKKHIPELREKLNGYIVLIRGNHDPSREFMFNAGFDEVHDQLKITLQDVKLMLRHYPLAPELRYAPMDCDYYLHGHVHELWRRQGKLINVGVDQWNLQPQKLETLIVCEDQPKFVGSEYS